MLGTLFFLIFCGLGVFFCVLIGREFLQVLASQGWPQADCVILESKVVEEGGHQTRYRVQLRYAYEWQGRQYTSESPSSSEARFSNYAAADRMARRFPIDTKAICHVNPRAPGESVLLRRSRWFGLLILWPLFFVEIGVLGILALWRKAGESRGSIPVPVPSGEVSRLQWESEDPAAARQLRPAHSRVGQVVGVGVFTILWNGFLFFSSSWGLGSGRSSGRLIMGLFMIPFYLVGLCLVGVVIYRVLALFNPKVELAIKPGVPMLGAGLEVSWRLTGRTAVLRSFHLYLEGREEATSRQGTRTVTDRKPFLRIDVTTESSLPVSGEGKGQVMLPADTVPSFRSANNRIVWAIQVRGDITRWPDLREEFEIQVRPRAIPPAA